MVAVYELSRASRDVKSRDAARSCGGQRSGNAAGIARESLPVPCSPANCNVSAMEAPNGSSGETIPTATAQVVDSGGRGWVRPVRVVVVDIEVEDAFEVAASDDQHLVEALATCGCRKLVPAC